MTERFGKLRSRSLTFNGKITASLSHEMNNVLAIIHEHNGLLKDMLADLERGVPVDDAKLTRISKKIGSQIERGKIIVTRLNKFSHRTDKESASVDLNEIAAETIDLSRRLTGMKGLVLEMIGEPRTIPLITNAHLLQQAIFTCFEIFMDKAADNRTIKVSILELDGKPAIAIAGSSLDGIEKNIRLQELAELIEVLQGSYELSRPAKREHVLILKPGNLEK